MESLDRKRPARLPLVVSGKRPPIVFLTVCADKRRPILARPDCHRCLLEAWRAAGHWRIGHYVVMPDHIHLFCSPAAPDSLDLRRWTGFWKSLASRRWPYADEQPVWQTDAWDTQLRSGDSYSAKWQYVRNNPVRAGLVDRPENWPSQGQLDVSLWQ